MFEFLIYFFVSVLLSYFMSFLLAYYDKEEYKIYFNANYKIFHFICIYIFLYLSFHNIPLEKVYLIKAFGLFFMFYFLYFLALIDLKFKLVPTFILLLSFIASVIYNGIDSLLIGLILIGSFVFLKLFFEALFSIEILGEGDIPIFGIFGVLFGLSNVLLLSLFVSFICGIFMFLCFYIFKKEIFFPFIPSLFLGILFGLYFSIHKVSYLVV